MMRRLGRRLTISCKTGTLKKSFRRWRPSNCCPRYPTLEIWRVAAHSAISGKMTSPSRYRWFVTHSSRCRSERETHSSTAPVEGNREKGGWRQFLNFFNSDWTAPAAIRASLLSLMFSKVRVGASKKLTDWWNDWLSDGRMWMRSRKKNVIHNCTVVQNRKEYRLKYWATRSSVWSFAPPLTHLLATHSLLCPRAPLHSLVCSLAHFAHSLARGTVIE